MSGKNVSRRMLAKNLEEQLRNQILSGKLTPGTPILSAKKLAEKHGISPLTANKAVKSLVSENLLYRIKGSGTYVSNRKKSLKIGLGFESHDQESTIPELSPFYDNLSSISDKLIEMQHNIRYISLRELYDRKTAESLLDELDGLLIFRRYVNDITLQLLEQWNKPTVVFLHETVDDIQLHQVVLDLSPGIKHAIEHIKKSGLKKLFLASRTSSTHVNRRKLFYDACQKFGFSSKNIIEIVKENLTGDQGRLTGQQIAGDILDSPHKNSAVFSTGGYIAFGIMDKFVEDTSSSGNTPSLISIDNLNDEKLSSENQSSISFIDKRVSRGAERALELLLQCIETREEDYIVVKIPSVFIH